MKPAGRRYPADEATSIPKQNPMLPHENDIRAARMSRLLDDKRLESIQRQPGVLAVLAFYEGFAVKSVGSGDFEQVAAVAEDFLRAGEKIVSDMKMGSLSQITLEAGDKKCIVVPYGDLFLCLLTRGDVNLGLIRLMVRHLQGKNGAGNSAGP
jgi:predicted regulator of Ras-like GTPase activity (Roadblock/LC7/MglB family)